MVEKYGEGDTSIHKCRTCDHEQEIRSAGVHVSEGGSISVFKKKMSFIVPIVIL